MSTDTIHFYELLNGFADFSEFHNARWYQPLPEDWCVVMADIQGSTRAIERGRYKEINAVGVASIVALTNAVKPLKIPYVFGGDGVTACIPTSLLETIKPALVASKDLSRERFDLELRIGVVPLGVIRQAGFDVLLGKYQPHRNYQQAMFLGGGLGYSERLVKSSDQANPYLVCGGAGSGDHIFDGFECRWNEIPSPGEENIALLVQALGEDDRQRDRTYADVLKQIKSIYGEETQYHPLQEEGLSLTGSFRFLSIEARIRTVMRSEWDQMKYLLRLQVMRLVGIWIMACGTRTKFANWGEYKKNMMINTDYRKFDDLLRMVISGSKSQSERLRVVLENYREEGRIVFGIQASRSSLITCIVTNYDKDHVHFLDGASGGYAMAAKELKLQLKGS